MNSPDFFAQYTKKSDDDSWPTSGYTSTRNTPQEITKLDDTFYPLHYTGKSLKFESIHRKDFILLDIVLFFIKLLELN